jgi:hypothetical protein
LTPKHLGLKETHEKRKKEQQSNKPHIFECKVCNYICSTNFNLDRHLSTSKHEKKANGNKIIEKVYPCACGKTYKHASSLWKHSHSCEPLAPAVSSQVVDPKPDDTILRLVEENRELTKIIIEQTRNFDEMIAKRERETINTEPATHTTTTTNTTQNNINVNIRFVLNDNCYDAKQLIEFLTRNNETNLTV